MTKLNRFLAVCFAAGAALLSPLATSARADTVVLKDGTKLIGKIENESSDYIFVLVKIGELNQRKLVARNEIKEIVRDKPAEGSKDAATKDAEAAAGSGTGNGELKKDDKDAAPERAKISEGATKVCVVTLEEMVGPFMNADALKHSVELIPKDEKPDVLVIKINSGGGALNEVPLLSDYIHKELKKEYRVVAWIESAISAAAMTAMNIEEIYMMERGHVGGAVAFSMTGPGKAEAMKGAGLEMVLELGQNIAKRGKYDPLVIRAMQEFFSLSCDIDDAGRITWRNDEKGQFVVNPKTRILTLNSIDAKKFGISKGNAETLPELCKVMGLTEWVEVGKVADKYQVEFRDNVQKAQVKIQEIQAKLEIIMNFATTAQDPKERNGKIGEALNLVGQMESWVRRAPSLEVYEGLTKERFQQIREQLNKMRVPTR